MKECSEIVYTDRTEWRDEDGQLIRLMRNDGDVFYYSEGELHRLDGPAVETECGYRSWYIEGVPFTEDQFNLLTKYSKKP